MILFTLHTIFFTPACCSIQLPKDCEDKSRQQCDIKSSKTSNNTVFFSDQTPHINKRAGRLFRDKTNTFFDKKETMDNKPINWETKITKAKCHYRKLDIHAY